MPAVRSSSPVPTVPPMSSERASILRTDAVVLRSVDYGETSRIVTLFTRDRGKVGVMARGARSGRSRFGSTLEPMAYIEAVIHVKPARDLQTLSEASHVRIFPRLKGSIERIGPAVRAVELTSALMQDDQSLAPALDLLVETLDALDSPGERAANAWPWFALGLAHMLGFSPSLDRDAVESVEDEGWLMLATGSVSAAREPGDVVRASRAALRAFTVCARAPLDTVTRMRLAPPVRHELDRLVDAFLRYHVEDAFPDRAARVLARLDPS